ncbi:hypothetical protein D5086_030326 [Populus alba]|uniref:Uncharacterized protein n=1 Tax=Populus alba TaxID=43335 RepID=A0ACC4ANA9_POPAL
MIVMRGDLVVPVGVKESCTDGCGDDDGYFARDKKKETKLLPLDFAAGLLLEAHGAAAGLSLYGEDGDVGSMEVTLVLMEWMSQKCWRRRAAATAILGAITGLILWAVGYCFRLKNRENGGCREGERMATSFLSKWWLLEVAEMVATEA